MKTLEGVFVLSLSVPTLFNGRGNHRNLWRAFIHKKYIVFPSLIYLFREGWELAISAHFLHSPAAPITETYGANDVLSAKSRKTSAWVDRQRSVGVCGVLHQPSLAPVWHLCLYVLWTGWPWVCVPVYWPWRWAGVADASAAAAAAAERPWNEMRVVCVCVCVCVCESVCE